MDGSGATERTALLPHSDAVTTPAGPQKDVPYKNIDGKRFKWVFASILMSFVLVFFDSSLMSSSHPVITSYFNSSNVAPWLSTVFYLTSTVTQPLFGRVSDTTGRRPVYLFTMAAFGLTTAWCGLAQSMGSFIAARTVCGIGGGGVLAMSTILLADVVKIEHRGLYQSYLNMAYAIGNGLGAALGGLICDTLGWRWAFGFQIPLIFVLFSLGYLVVPADLGPNLAASQGINIREALRDFDVAGSFILVTTVSGLILGINLGGSVYPWSHPLVLAALCVFAVTAIGLVFVENRAKQPVLPMQLLSAKPQANLMWSNFFAGIVTNTMLFNIPLLLQAVRQTTPTVSGLWLLGPLFGSSCSSIFTGFYIKWTKRLKPMMVLGVVTLAVAAPSVSALTVLGLPLWTAVLLDPWASIAQGFLFPATTVATLASSPDSEAAVVTTTLFLTRNLGSVMGVAFSSLIFENLLALYLERIVTGQPEPRRRMIDDVRKSVRAIKRLAEPHKGEVIESYALALRFTFLSVSVFAMVTMILIVPLHVPALGSSPSKGAVTHVDSGAEERSDTSRSHARSLS